MTVTGGCFLGQRTGAAGMVACWWRVMRAACVNVASSSNKDSSSEQVEGVVGRSRWGSRG